MALIFFVLGWLGIFGGGAWLGLALFTAIQAGASLTPADLLPLVATSSPAIGLLGLGLVLLAIAGILGRLDRIARNTADTADAVEAILKQNG